MNPIAEEIFSYLSEDDDTLMHYGMPKRSGRYPYGSGEDPYQRNRDLLGRYAEYKKQGLSEVEIAREMKMLNKKGEPSTDKLRLELRYAKDERKLYDISRAKSLAQDGLGPSEIGRKMGGVSESTVRGWLKEGSEANVTRARKTADIIKAEIDKRGMLDVGPGVERELRVSEGVLKEALFILSKEGYPTYSGRIPQVTNPGKQTTQTVVCPPGTEHKEIYNFEKVHSFKEYAPPVREDQPDKFVYPKSMDSSRLQIRYAEDGGVQKDGVVEIRRGVEDLSLGGSHYAQVRILVDDTKYIKGMAVYSDDMPDGVDIVFNTNKSKSVAKMDVLKNIKDDPDNPFGSLIKAGGQSYYIDKNGNKQLSLINKRADEGDWTEWQDALPSQFLGKQSLALAKKQLALAKADKIAEFDDICALNNPTIKKHYLKEFADNCDSAAVHLKAAALPGQKYHVIIPVNTLKDNEIYAPGYENGTKLALVRYPHGGIFEIPILTVNNKHAPARKIIGDGSIDAVGINKNIADRLSGADFDGDTVMCIPTHDSGGKVRIASKPQGLKDLEGFDPKEAYGPDTYKNRVIKPMKRTDLEMGKISNLITDMTLAGAPDEELARAVRHSMVVIDAEKHKLDYKKSEIDHNISALKRTYQINVDKNGNIRYGGASTILSRAKGEFDVEKRQGTPKINQKDKPWYDPDRPEGAYIYKTSDKAAYTTTVNGKTVTKTRRQKSTRMAETDDAYTLVSKGQHPMELLYAEYANSMKALANTARLEYVKPEKIKYSSAAKDTYAEEVSSLKAKLNTALLNNPREREAQRRANVEVDQKKVANPNIKKDDIKKASQQAITSKRVDVGATSRRQRNIDITDREWEAIQAGAVTENVLRNILMNTDADKLRDRCMPKTTAQLSVGKINKIKSMSSSNYTLEQIAKACGVSKSTVSNYLKGVN